MELMVEHTTYTLKAGESFVIPNGFLHAVHAVRHFKMILSMIRG